MQLYTRGRIYDWLIEPMVKGVKKKVAFYFQAYDFFPALDICCGTGTQCHLLKNIHPHSYGLDIDLKMVEYAAKKYPYRAFICADAVDIPFKDHSFKGVLISFSLHDKTSETQTEIMNEALRVLKSGGTVVFVDFENPWNIRSRLGSVLTFMIEKIAGGEHFRNNRRFLEQGGLRAFIQRHKLIEVKRYNIEMGAIAIVLAQPLNT
jgi:ubiquinone/menaquinone biosynthesis C-methylase UbiE